MQLRLGSIIQRTKTLEWLLGTDPSACGGWIKGKGGKVEKGG